MEENPNTQTEAKPWDVAWTIDQIKSSANSWSLAGNAGVSCHLLSKQFKSK